MAKAKKETTKKPAKKTTPKKDKVELYRCKPRLGNEETYIEVRPHDDKLLITHLFRGGTTFVETWQKKTLNELKKKKLLTKTTKVSWKVLDNAEEVKKAKEAFKRNSKSKK
jgi:hypothetical protein